MSSLNQNLFGRVVRYDEGKDDVGSIQGILCETENSYDRFIILKDDGSFAVCRLNSAKLVKPMEKSE